MQNTVLTRFSLIFLFKKVEYDETHDVMKQKQKNKFDEFM